MFPNQINIPGVPVNSTGFRQVVVLGKDFLGQLWTGKLEQEQKEEKTDACSRQVPAVKLHVLNTGHDGC